MKALPPRAGGALSPIALARPETPDAHAPRFSFTLVSFTLA